MKRILWNITLASLITLLAYIVVVGLLLRVIDNSKTNLILIAVMTSIAFGFFLLYTTKIRKSVGENEVVKDYKEKKYTSFADDFKMIINREAKTLICIGAIILICFVYNTFDSLVFGNKTISYPTFFFAPMCLLSTAFNIPFVGYLLSIVIDSVAYMFFLLIYRKKTYNYWVKNKA